MLLANDRNPERSAEEDTMRLAKKTAVITGGNSGIGLATARLFLAEGARVAITGRNEKTLREAAESLGSGVLILRGDVTDPVATEDVFRKAAESLGPIDIVFANAGSGGASKLGATTFTAFEDIVRANFTSAFFTAQAALPHLRDGGSIIFNGSVHAVLGAPGYSAYGGAKAAIRAMTRSLAAELAPRGIRVNQVTPGGTRTPIWASRAPTAEAMAALEAGFARMVPLGHMADAADIAHAALYLASDDARNVSGTEIVVDGGTTSSPLGAPIYR
jgi:NAD(P)-dependent dehydrogenase (short-subunit alcohol dehydrogenase family)